MNPAGHGARDGPVPPMASCCKVAVLCRRAARLCAWQVGDATFTYTIYAPCCNGGSATGHVAGGSRNRARDGDDRWSWSLKLFQVLDLCVAGGSRNRAGDEINRR